MSWDRGFLDVTESAQHAEAIVPRIVLVGQSLSGKRTLCNALLRALDEKLKQHRSGVQSNATAGSVAHNGPGLGHTSIPPAARALSSSSSQEATIETELTKVLLKNGAELFLCNHREALVPALPTWQVAQHSIIVFVVDLTEPETVPEQMQAWTGRVRDRVVQLLGTASTKSNHATTSDLIRPQASLLRDEWKHAAALPAVQQVAKSLSHGSKSGAAEAGPMLDVPLDGVCPLPSVVFLNKIDSLEAVCQDARNDVPGVAMPVSQYVLQWGRKLAILSGSAFVAASAKKWPNQSARGLLLYCLLLARNGQSHRKQSDNNEGASQPLLDDNEDDNALSAPPTPQQDKVHTALRSADGGEELVVATVSEATSSHGTGVGVTMPFIPRGADALSNLAVNNAVPISAVFTAPRSDSTHTAGSDGNEVEMQTYAQLVEEIRHLAEQEANKKDTLLWTMF